MQSFKKNQMKNKLVLTAAGLILFATIFKSENTYAQATDNDLLGQINAITTAVPFLIITPDARAGALGDCGVASSPDAASIHWNPAKLAFSENNMGFAVSYTPWLRKLVPDINLAYLSGYGKFGKKKLQAVGGSLRYFSLGDITFTDNVGNIIGNFRPNEFALDFAYARKLSDYFSMGVALRYVNSNLTGGISVEGAATKAAQAGAGDVSFFYTNPKIKIKDLKTELNIGLNISNIGNKVSYTNTSEKDFIPTNLRLGFSYKLNVDEYNSIAIMADVNKLLVPTNPTRDMRQNVPNPIEFIPDNREYIPSDGSTGTINQGVGNINNTSPIAFRNDPYSKGHKDSIPNPNLGGQMPNPEFGADMPNPNYLEITAGKDPNVSVISGIFQSFGDAPLGFKEEMRELTYSIGLEYWYNKMFSVRAGYFGEHVTKGNRKYVTLGAGIRYNVFGLDFAYLIPTQQRHPLENTLRFTLTFDFANVKAKKDTEGATE